MLRHYCTIIRETPNPRQLWVPISSGRNVTATLLPLVRVHAVWGMTHSILLAILVLTLSLASLLCYPEALLGERTSWSRIS